jgi:adenosine kinase
MQLVISGSMSVDQIMLFDGLFENLIQPDKLHVLSISQLVDRFERTRGGTAGNMAYSLALLGEKPQLVVSIGQDSRPYIEDLAASGVDITRVHFSHLPTATFSVLTDKNNCQVGGFYPGAMSDTASLSFTTFANQDILAVVSAHDPAAMAQQISECKKLGLRLFFDVGQQSLVLPKKVLQDGIDTAELLIVNDYEMGLLASKTGWSESEIQGKVTTCVVTLGEKGVKIWYKGTTEPLQVDAVKVQHVVDPTGAGDAFRAGFLYGYIRNWPVIQSAQVGAVVASYVVEKHGTQQHTFTWNDLKKRYKKQYKKELPL